MSRKSCSSNSEHSHSADSTSASGVALPYLAMIRLSRLPALTPIRIGVPDGLGRRATSPTLPSNSRMLPGLTRTAAQPASIAAKMYLLWKWMSAMTGICDLLDDLRQRLGVDRVGHGDAHDLAAGRGQLGDLLQRRVDVGGDGRRHGLHADRRAAADEHAADVELAGAAPLGQAGGRELGHAERDRDGGHCAESRDPDGVDDVGAEQPDREAGEEQRPPRR